MAEQILNAELLSRMFIAGANSLEQKKDWINELNVFPVPDGDTGTNMSMTILSAVREIQGLQDVDMKSLCKAISSGSLRGARGNSGVILSQLFRGFTKSVRDKDEITIPQIADACERAVETAYKAVIKPKEGTILTVAKGMADMARKQASSQLSLEEYVHAVLEYGKRVLEQTPEMLPVLKEAGVVDSGGQGLIVVIEGAYDALTGKETAPEGNATEAAPETVYGYSTDLIVSAAEAVPEERMKAFRAFLETIGDAMILQPSPSTVHVHMLTDEPGRVITKALTLGPLTDIRVVNLHLDMLKAIGANAGIQNAAAEQKAAEPPKKVGFVSVCAGEGFAEIFRGLNVDVVIEGGQTMNPSTEDLLNAIDRINAENIYLYPNNKNIIMAANQARELVQEKNVIVIPTKTVPQGISAILAYEPDATVEQNQQAMYDMIANVRTGELTYAVRDTKIDDIVIHQGDIMAVGDDGLLEVGPAVHEVALASVEKMMFDEAELISVYYGQEFAEEDAAKLAQALTEAYPECDVEVENGGQPVYYCIISVE